MVKKGNSHARRGAVLILVLGVLIVLALLATTFARLQTVELDVARNFTDDVRAKLLAQSGIEDILPRLQSLGTGPEWLFMGNDINENGILGDIPEELDTGEVATDPAVISPTIEKAKNPSFAVELDDNPASGAANSRVVFVEVPSPTGMVTKRWGFSGVLGQKTRDASMSGSFYNSYSGTYVKNGDLYSVRVADTAGSIYVNDGVSLLPISQPSGPGAYSAYRSSTSENLINVLNNLGWACGVPSATQVGKLIVHNRPPTGFVSKFEIEGIIGTTNFNKIKDMVTVNAWVDKNVVNPVPLSAQAVANGAYRVSYWRGGASPVYRHGGNGAGSRGVNYVNDASALNTQPLIWYQPAPGLSGPAGSTQIFDCGVYGSDELHPQYVEVAWRAPVNVNTASLQVLEALIADVHGFFLLEKRSNAPHGNACDTFSYQGAGYGGSFITCTVTQPSLPTYGGHTWMYEMQTFDKTFPKNAVLYATAFGGGTANISAKPDMDELGFLYTTCPFRGSWTGTGSGYIPGKAIAQHIDACRKARPGVPSPVTIFGFTVDYSSKHFGGPFRSWGQFYEFLDFLVDAGVIKDTRLSMFYDYDDMTSSASDLGWAWSSYANLPRLASQAAADALKANFNPNCHLNDFNNDRNMHLMVDKTDLIGHSTELTFRPTGYFEIESLGRLLRPLDAATDAFLSTKNEIRAEKKVVVSVKMFDLYRETSQRHYYGPAASSTNASAIAPRDKDPETNNNLSLEIGPEQDNHAGLPYGDNWNGYFWTVSAQSDGYAGPAPTGGSSGWGFESDGFIRLASIGGPSTSIPPAISFTLPTGSTAPVAYYGVKTQRPQLLDTPNGVIRTTGLGKDATMRAHFALDDKLSYSQSAFELGQDWMRENLSGNMTDRNGTMPTDTGTIAPMFTNANQRKIEKFRNYPDYNGLTPDAKDSPYDPTDGPSYRNCRSFRLPLSGGSGTSTAGTGPGLTAYAPSDMRLDGFYSERGSAPAYWFDHGRTWDNYTGAVSVWVKPNWYPEHSGKPRKFIGMSRYHGKNLGYKNPQGMDVDYIPAINYPFGSNPASTYESTPYGASILYPFPYPGGAGNDAPEDALGGRYIKFWRPMSLTFDNWMDCFSGSLDDMNHEGPWLEYHFATLTDTLNHNDHIHTSYADMFKGHQPQANQLEGHRWSHLAFQWYIDINGTRYSYHHASRIWMNAWLGGGKAPGDPSVNNPTWGSAGGLWMDNCWSDSGRCERPYYYVSMQPPEIASIRYANSIRLGEVHYHGIKIESGEAQIRFPRNYAADATFDELYMWKGPSTTLPAVWTPSDATDTFLRGRYYAPTTGLVGATGVSAGPTESFYISPWLSFSVLGGGRVLPPPSTVAPPVATGGGGGPGSSGGSGTVSTPPAGSGAVKRLLGVSWTWHPEAWDATVTTDPVNPQSFGRMIPIAHDWVDLRNNQNPAAPSVLPGAKLKQIGVDNQGVPMCRLFVDHKTYVGGITQYPLGDTRGYLDDGYSQIVTATGQPLPLAAGDQFRYKVWFQIQGVTPTTVLLASPYFDDVTFYFDEGQPTFLSWSVQTM